MIDKIQMQAPEKLDSHVLYGLGDLPALQDFRAREKLLILFNLFQLRDDYCNCSTTKLRSTRVSEGASSELCSVHTFLLVLTSASFQGRRILLGLHLASSPYSL